MVETATKTLELFFEVADTSLYSGLIGSSIEDYKEELKLKKIDKVAIKCDFNVYENFNSSYYKILIWGNIEDTNLLYRVSCQLRDKILELKDFKNLVVVTKDDANIQMCEKLYPRILNIETRLRALVNRIYMRTLGEMWNKELETKIKQAGDERNSGFDLNETTLETLTNLIFGINKTKNKKISSKILQNKNITRIESKTPWQHFFPKVNLKIEYMHLLKNVRNKVMHGKQINYNYFNQNNKNCDKVIKCLDIAEEQIIGKKFELSQEVVNSLNLILENMSKILK